MRVAFVSDIHGNLSGLEAVLADLRFTAPDLVLHGGDLAHGGARPAEVVDCVRALGWEGVVGNADEVLFRPESLTEFSSSSRAPAGLFSAIGEIAAATRAALGDERLAWLRGLPLLQTRKSFALVHARPGDVWRAPGAEASDAELEAVYAPLGRPVAVYGHIHQSFVRNVGRLIVANSGSVSLSHDGDRRASYLLLDGGTATLRRVEYEVERELNALAGCGLPHADWMGRMLANARPSLP